jgi:phospholipid/cholesterol/gamma-HCH transport system ATP-binding protein
MRCIKLTADRIVVLIDGVSYAEGKFEELEKSVDNRVKQYFE